MAPNTCNETVFPITENHLDGQMPTTFHKPLFNSSLGDVIKESSQNDDVPIRIALLGCGMMGQEHISYITGYDDDARIDFLCDPHEPSLEKSIHVMEEFSGKLDLKKMPTIVRNEEELLERANDIDLLVIATPNYLHTPSLLKWGKHDMTILVEKPVAVSQEQLEQLQEMSSSPDFLARVWVAMEYRYIPAVAKLLSLVSSIGELKMVTIRENRYPFLHKVGSWNRDAEKTGDTLVEKCCHFFDLFRLITGSEVSKEDIRALAQRGLNYRDEPTFSQVEVPIIDSAYVIMPFKDNVPDASDSSSFRTREEGKSSEEQAAMKKAVVGCLELCMYAEGSRHQEEIIVTGTGGRIEAYLPENKVFYFRRPNKEEWIDRSVPPPPNAIHEEVFDCSDVKGVHGIDEGQTIPTHGGYHYSSTAVEWYSLIAAMKKFKNTGRWEPHVSLMDGIRAVDIGLRATKAIENEQRD